MKIPKLSHVGAMLLRRASLGVALIAYGSIAAYAQGTAASAQALLNTGYDSLLKQNYDGAITSYEAALKLRPGFAAGWNNLGSAYFAKQEFRAAAKAFLQAVRFEPENADYHFNASLALVRSDRCDEALPQLAAASSSEKHRAADSYLRGTCAFVQERWTPAVTQLLAAESFGSRSPELYYMLTVASRKAKNPAGAERAYGQLSTLYPNDPLQHELLAEASDRNNDETKARSEITDALTARPQEPGLHAQLGFLLWKAHNLNGAIPLFEQELAIDGGSYTAAHYLGDIAEKQARLTDSLHWYRLALRNQPLSAQSHFDIGRVLAEQGNYAVALLELQASLPQLEQDGSVQYWMARTLQRLGKPREAALHLARVREINNASRQAILSKVVTGVHE